MNRTQARDYINGLIHTELVKAPKRISGHDTYICPFCVNGSGTNGTGISTSDGKYYKCFKCDFGGDYLDYLKKQYAADETDIFIIYNLAVDEKQMCSPPIQEAQPLDYKDFFLQAQKNLRNSPEALAYLQSRVISP